MAKKPGDGAIVLTDDQIRQIETLAGLGLNQVEIASVLGIGRATLQRKMAQDQEIADAMERGKSKAKATIARVAYEMAKTNPVMTQFYLKCLGGWRTADVEVNVNNNHIQIETTKEQKEAVKRRMSELFPDPEKLYLESQNLKDVKKVNE